MMIRSAPPASAHFADSPVPAPAPMIGLPASICARSRASASARVTSSHPPRSASISSCSRFAIASAKAGSLTSASTSCTSTLDGSTSSRSVSNSASSASGSWNTCPSMAIIETPRSGTKSTVGPVAALSLRAMIAAISRHSSGVVRISVMVGLWTYRFRSR